MNEGTLPAHWAVTSGRRSQRTLLERLRSATCDLFPTMTERRYCSNCRLPLPPNASACASCGVFAGDVFDGRKPRPKKPPSGILFFLLVAAILGTAGWWLMHQSAKPAPPPPAPPLPSLRVVADRPGGSKRVPGAKVTEAEAIRILRRHLVASTAIRDECLVLMSLPVENGAYRFTAVDTCQHTRLGRWRVDGRTGAVVRGAG
jgi:hypothetical protein